jgi:hypothetical protein
MDDIKLEPNSEVEIQPSGSDMRHIKTNQEETEPMSFVEVKCELEVRQVVGLGCKHRCMYTYIHTYIHTPTHIHTHDRQTETHPPCIP